LGDEAGSTCCEPCGARSSWRGEGWDALSLWDCRQRAELVEGSLIMAEPFHGVVNVDIRDSEPDW
jgi:hypothetical protein